MVMLGLTAGLLIKDLLPIQPGFGMQIRTIDPQGVPAPLAWYPRNPDLPAAGVQLGALLLGVAVALGLRHRVLSGRSSARAFGTTCLALVWGFALMRLASEPAQRNWLEWAPAVSSKNAAATLIAVGFILQLETLRHGLREAKGLRIGVSLVGLGLFIRELATLNSGTGILAAASGTLVYLLGWIAPDRKLWGQNLVWTAAVIGIGAVLLVSFNWTLSVRLFGGGNSFRWEIWRDCMALLAAAPAFGVGCGAFAAVHPLHSQLNLSPDAFLAHPDSGYVMLLVEWGIVPCLIVAGAIIRWLIHLARSELESIDHALLGGLVALATAAVTDPTFQRMPTFFIGCALAGTLAGRHPGHHGFGPDWLRRSWLPVVGAVATAALIWGLRQQADLRWRPLSAELQAKVGSERWKQRPGDPIALAHLQASVDLKRWSSDFATYAALHVHGFSPIQAVPLWQQAFARGKDAGGVALGRGRKAFPNTPLSYWADLTLTSNPDIALQLAGAEPIVARRIATEWLARRGQQATPTLWRTFISFCTRSGQTEALRTAQPMMPPEDIALQLTLGRAFRSLGDLESAWSVLSRVFPLPPAPPSRGEPLTLGAKALLDLGRFDDLQRLTMQPEFKGPKAVDVLKQILVRAGVSPWFRLRLAYLHAEEKRWEEAIALLPNDQTGR